MAFTFTENSVTVSTTEISLYNGTSTIATRTEKGIAQVFVEVDSMAAGDEFEFAFRGKTRSASTQAKHYICRISFGDNKFTSPTFVIGNGWDFSMTKIAGTDRNVQSSIRFVPE